jgi:MFS family permease
MLARVPTTAMGIALTLHVVETIGPEYVKAGLVGMASTIGMAIGSPLSGRFVDKHGLRPVLLVTTSAQALFWACAWALPYPALVGAAALAGLLMLPVSGVIRQCLAAMVPAPQRRTGFALDSMLVELSYMIGPALAVAGMTTLGGGVTMVLIGTGLTVAGLGLIVLNPPIRSAAEEEEREEREGPTPRSQWFTPAFAALLGTLVATTFVLTATELALIATMTSAHQTAWIGLALGVWCVYSLVGGFLYGGLPRGFSPLVLIAAMGLLTIPVGLASGDWRWLILALLPAGLLCAPSLSSTVNVVTSWVPARARGEAMGYHSTALLIGSATSAPVAGAVIDGAGPAWAFAVAGLVGVVMVVAALPFWHRRPAGASPAEGEKAQAEVPMAVPEPHQVA